jgi:hypothetical protein
MRSSYPAALQSYVRPLSLITLFGLLQWALFALSVAGPFVDSTEREILGAVLCYPVALCVLAAFLATHLREMLGNPTFWLTPQLHQAHLRIAAIITVVATMMVPGLLCLLAGQPQAILPMAAFAFAVFVGAATLVHHLPMLIPIVAVAPGCLIPFAGRSREATWEILTVPSSLLLITASVAGLFLLGKRLARFSEELPEFHRRFPYSNPGGAKTNVGGWVRVTPMSRNLRKFNTRGGAANETILERAMHFNVAWRPLWGATIVGVMLGGMDLLYFTFLVRGSANQDQGYFVYSRMAFLAAIPAMIISLPGSRQFVAARMLWPYSRTQFVQGFALLLAMSCGLCWVLMNLVPFVGLKLLYGINALNATSVRVLIFSACSLPFFLGLFSWPWRTGRIAAGMVAGGISGVVGLSIPQWGGTLMGLPFVIVALLILAAGITLDRVTYRRWLMDDVE